MGEINLTLERDRKMEKAIKYLSNELDISGHNSKPVLLHSIRVGFYLYDQGYSNEIILAGILHDILEDTETSKEELKLNFGDKVVNIVEANTFNTDITDGREQFEELFKRCRLCGKEALIVKGADILANSNYYRFAKNDEMRNLLMLKMKRFIEVSESLIKDELIWSELNEKYEELISQFLNSNANILM